MDILTLENSIPEFKTFGEYPQNEQPIPRLYRKMYKAADVDAALVAAIDTRMRAFNAASTDDAAMIHGLADMLSEEAANVALLFAEQQEPQSVFTDFEIVVN